MARARDRRREQRDGEPEPRGERAAPADRVLELQRSAGNAAVSELLARSPEAAVPADAKQGAPASVRRATLEGIGTIAIESVSFGVSGPNRRRREEGEEEPRDLVITSRAGAHSTALMKALTEGRPMAGEIVLPPSVKLTLKGAMLSSYSTSGQGGEQMETWTLNVASVEQETKTPAPGDRPAP